MLQTPPRRLPHHKQLITFIHSAVMPEISESKNRRLLIFTIGLESRNSFTLDQPYRSLHANSLKSDTVSTNRSLFSLLKHLPLSLSFPQGVPEDLLWFYQSLRRGGGVIRVDECILIYRYHEHAATHSVLE